jgi:hypothetical protein
LLSLALSFALHKYYIGLIVVSGGVVPVVSTGFAVVSTGIAEESVIVLSAPPETLFVELQADAAIIIVPANARLKISFFIIRGFSNVFSLLNTLSIYLFGNN